MSAAQVAAAEAAGALAADGRGAPRLGQKPDNLGFAREDDWTDAFVGWFPNKHVAVVAAYANLGSIATLPRQRGAYLSLQLSY